MQYGLWRREERSRARLQPCDGMHYGLRTIQLVKFIRFVGFIGLAKECDKRKSVRRKARAIGDG